MRFYDELVESIGALQKALDPSGDEVQATLQKVQHQNPWFTPSFTTYALEGLRSQMLDVATFKRWWNAYSPASGEPKRVGLVLAGNLPLVGFHDILCVIASGHKALIKCSERDQVLTAYVLDAWKKIWPALEQRFEMVEKLVQIDAVIATGSDNSARYFEFYFGKYPHIFRRNRNGIAILFGDESEAQLKALADDIFLYYGMGCRNVSKVYVPQGYDFAKWNEPMSAWLHLADHHKYKNNLDYNYALYLINQIPHIHMPHLIVREDAALASRIGCVHYETWTDLEELVRLLQVGKEDIQCIVSSKPVAGLRTILPGQTQRPGLSDYADGIDTMEFLQQLN